MVNFIRKRLQVFVSSTYSDLIDERQAAVEAILTAGHIPAGMELFTSGDESQMEVIKQWIEESDVFLLILGGRYGSVEPTTGKSYIHLEYELAVRLGKPLFACVVSNEAQARRLKEYGIAVQETAHPDKLNEFRNMVLSRLVRFWEDRKDIKIAVGETLAHFSRRDDLVGWVRSPEAANMPALADEIARLSSENARLRKRAEAFESVQRVAGLAYEELLQILRQKNLLEILTKNREVLGLGDPFQLLTGADAHVMSDLAVLGLIEPLRHYHPVHYVLSEGGRLVLNRLALQDLTSST